PATRGDHYTDRMVENLRNDLEAELVAIVRDFLVSQKMLTTLVDRQAEGSLRFEDIQDFVGDSGHSVLFRLKEHCHALFRSGAVEPMPRGEIFDLAVGSLFHEAMKLRESLYQREVYAPKVEDMRLGAGRETEELFREFEKIFGASDRRLAETLVETQALFRQTQEQLRLLMVDHRENGLIARFLLENTSLIDEVVLEGLDGLLTQIYGDPEAAYEVAVRSYLDSAYFEEAARMISEIRGRSGGSTALDRLGHYAEGMQAFLAGSYSKSLERLARWVDAGPGSEEIHYAGFARAAVSRVGTLVDPEDRAQVESAGAQLERRISALFPGKAA
ncbi:MAG: hypothetical protein VCB42_11495, partial [Myxococcota bacterium]